MTEPLSQSQEAATLLELEDVDLDFACRCGEEGRVEVAKVRLWAEKELDTTDAAEMLDRIVFRMHWQYHAVIDDIAVDQWAAISAGTMPFYEKGVDHPYKPEDPSRQIEGLHTFVQCDSVFDGFLFTFRKFFEKYALLAPEPPE